MNNEAITGNIIFSSYLENQFLKLKVLCDYMFFDQFSERISFPRFEECINLLTKSQKFDLKKIFMELCGTRNKYITFPRLLSAYQESISNKSSSQLHAFFSFFMDSVIKSPSEISCVEVSNTKMFSTISHKNREFINKIELYTDKSNKIKGINIEYDHLYKNDFFADEHAKKKLKKKACLNLKKIDDLEEETNKENRMRDFVTHIYGTFTTKIEFLGFKTRAGKMSYTGDLKIGKAFLFGQFFHKFHYIKLKIGPEGIDYIQPFFIKSLYCNLNLQIDLEEYKDSIFPLPTTEKYEDEKVLENIENEDEYLNHVVTPLYRDDMFYKPHGEDIMPTKLKDLYSFQNQFTLDLKDCESANKTFGIFRMKSQKQENNYDNEQDNNFYKIYEAMIENEGGFGEDNNLNEDEEDQEDEEFTLNEEYDEEKLFEREMEKVEKLKQLKLYKLPYLRRWNGISVKMLEISSIFTDPFSLEKFIDRFHAEIQYEIETRIIKLNELTCSTSFYTKYFLNHDCYIHQYESKFFAPDYSEHLIKMKDEFEKVSEKNKNSNTEDISKNQTIEEESIANSDLKKSVTFKQINAKTLHRNWIRFGNHFKKVLTLGALKMGLAVNCAKNILVNCEDNFLDKSYSLATKIIVLNILCGIRPQKITENSTKEEVSEFLKKGVLSEVKRIIRTRKEARKEKEIEANQVNEDKKRKEEEIMNKSKQMELEKKQEIQKKVGEEKLTHPESKIFEKKNTAAILQQMMDKSIIIDNLKLIDSKLEKIQTIFNESSCNDKKDKKVLSEEYENLKRKKINSIKYLLEINKKEISEKVLIDEQELNRQQTEKRKQTICLQKELATKKKDIISNILKKQLNDPVTFSDIEIPASTKIYRAQQIVKGLEFTDEIFPSKAESLCPVNPKTKSWMLPPEIEEEDIMNWEKFQWERIDKIFRSLDYQIFVGQIEPADIIQGSLGDCYFLSALGSLSKFPELIQKLFLFKERSLDRCYGVYLRKNGIWKLVLVDDYIPCYGGSRKKFAFSSANQNEMWVVLLEKAWAKISGSFAKVIAGQSNEVFDATTNAPTEIIYTPQLEKEEIWSKLSEGKKKEFIMTAGTGDQVSMNEYNRVNLQSGHAYTIIDILEVVVKGETNRLIKIRNPWGNGEWSGDWSDRSPLWNSVPSKELYIENKDDGVFHMSFEDFVKYFLIINICRLHKNYHYSYIQFKKTEVSRPNLMTLDIEKESEVYLQIHQKNPRFSTKSGKKFASVLMHIMVVDYKMNFLASSCDDHSSIFVSSNLKPGRYYVYTDINYRYENMGEMPGYNVTTYSSNMVNLSKEANQNPIKILENSIISYAKSNLKLQKRDDLEFYSPQNIIPEFPFIFIVTRNTGKKITEVTLNLHNNRDSSIFPDENLKSKILTKKLEENQTDVFLIMRHKLDSSIEYNWNSRKINI